MLIMLLLYAIRIAKDFHSKYEEIKVLKNDLKGIMRQVQTSMKVAEQTVENLQSSIKFAATHVTPHIPKASALKEDLGFLIDRAESIADRLEKLGTEMKTKFMSPQEIVFDPEVDQIEAAIREAKREIEKEEGVSVEQQGFFTKLRRVRG